MSQLSVSEENGILKVILNRPEAHNALDAGLIKDITTTFNKVKKNQDIKAVFIKGEGKSFCAGGDLNWMRKSIKFSFARNIKDTTTLSKMYEAIFHCPAPVIAYAHGNVFGGGVGLAAVCDMVAAESETKFCLSEVKLGLVPSVISPYVLRKLPDVQARQLMLTAEIFDSAKAKEVGLINFSGNSEQCQEFIDERLSLIGKNGPEATRITKELIHKIKTSSWKTGQTLTIKTIAKRRISKEGQEGMNAFFEKRKPSWRS